VEALDSLGVDYMLTGALASSMQGAPRATHDIDIVVSLTGPDADRLLASFPPPDYYLSEASISEAISTGGTFNLVEPATGNKVDFWLLTDEPFDGSRFGRRQVVDFRGLLLKVSAPEDTILVKLKWSSDAGGSEKQFTDALRVYELQKEVLDHDYLARWATELGVAGLLQRLFDEAEPL
jgi:hypothetical protein